MPNIWTSILTPLQKRFRQRRARAIVARFPAIRGARVLDLGGSFPFWQIAGPIIQPAEVIIYNISRDRTTMSQIEGLPGVTLRLYDGVTVPEADGAFDFVISNSVIEHVPPADRRNFGEEIRRVGRNYVVQTPAIGFPIDQHFGLPFMHWLPRAIGRRLLPVTPFALFAKGAPAFFFEETRLLRRTELAGYFPGAEIVTERSLGLPKSLLVFG